ncbi:capsid assembly protein [Pyruvatibacter mobilis]|uniref:Capsid assembly protein n=1 Tax=Pyruvatibacter mobilis TaxID=1712261 RepID=A0A845Q7C6_9HYPH|nr:capsid assembly protein [Pyruvatibacter mobilis]NBG94495.1 capsid assembly protein [Pyruvatibacter mobilis]QJD74015.1 capsid assembly protein [Pyruvatibacter mobilis]GGD03380.1 hypothetical protein GCM10011587_03900 [Pyruvatibacter mobilis]
MSETVSVVMPVNETGPDAPVPSQTEPATPAPDSNTRPEWLPEKFENPQALADAYKALEAKLGTQAAADTPEDQPSPDPQDQPQQDSGQAPNFASNQAEVSNTLKGHGIDFGELQARYMETGELTPDDYATLQEAGFNRPFVDNWIEAQKALIAQAENAIYETVGGKDSYTKMVQWAAQNLPDEEIEAFNTAVESGDMAQARMAVSGLYARFTGASGSEPTLLAGQASTASEGFQSQAQMQEAMSDPRYRKDPAYRAEVERKIAAATFF